MNFPSQMFFNNINHGYRAAMLKKNPLWLLPFYVAVATSCYYETVRRTIPTTIISYILKNISCDSNNQSSHSTYGFISQGLP